MWHVRAIKFTRALVVGSGIAGLSTALGIGRCTVVTRGALGSGASRLAQGGIAAALGVDDAPRRHALDTVAVSAGMADPRVAQSVAAAAAGRIEWLEALGTCFDKRDGGRFHLGQEGCHSRRRIVHARGDATGAEVMRALTAAVRANRDIEIYEDHELIDLIREDGRVVGVLALDPSQSLVAFLAPAVVLATGGIGGLYARTTNPREVRGDGLAVAARAGARLADLEFVQFHPTALDADAVPAPLFSEALRGEGALLVNDAGRRFMLERHPLAELAPRDIVVRAIHAERSRGRRVYLDTAAMRAAAERFPVAWQTAQRAGIDPSAAPLPIAPAQHYHMGGVATDGEGRTTVPGLWAVGEVACTGLHGANRLASNSLLEGLVYAAAAGRSVTRAGWPPTRTRRLQVSAVLTQSLVASDAPAEHAIKERIRELMWRHVGIVRDVRGLDYALAELDRLGRRARSLPTRDLAFVGKLIATAALKRRESRGAHWRSDFPETDARVAPRSSLDLRPSPTTDLKLATARRVSVA